MKALEACKHVIAGPMVRKMLGNQLLVKSCCRVWKKKLRIAQTVFKMFCVFLKYLFQENPKQCVQLKAYFAYYGKDGFDCYQNWICTASGLFWLLLQNNIEIFRKFGFQLVSSHFYNKFYRSPYKAVVCFSAASVKFVIMNIGILMTKYLLYLFLTFVEGGLQLWTTIFSDIKAKTHCCVHMLKLKHRTKIAKFCIFIRFLRQSYETILHSCWKFLILLKRIVGLSEPWVVIILLLSER